MGFYENGIEGLIIEKDGQIEYKEEFVLTEDKTEELLDKIIPLENRKFIILSSYFCSVDMSGGKIQKEMDKDKLIEELKNDFAIQKLPRKLFLQNTCFVLLTLWSFNLMVDYKLSVLQDRNTLTQQLNSLRKSLFHFAAVVIYERCAIYLSFEITHEIQHKLLNFNGL